MRILAIIPARSGSKGLPGKNIRPFAGKPLLAHSIEAALCCSKIDQVVVSSDSSEIGAIAQKYGAMFQDRPIELATDDSSMEVVLKYCLQTHERQQGLYDTVLLLQPTSPLRTSEDIKKAIQIFSKNYYDTVVSVYPFHGLRYRLENTNLVPLFGKRGIRQHRTTEYVENGAIFLTQAQLLRDGKIFGERLGAYLMPPERSIDIDSLEDFTHAEALYHFFK